MTPDPFAVLGLPSRPDLPDEQVRAAWRAIAAATHPDRADGGDLARYTAASAAYADLIERAGPAGQGDGPVTAPIPAVPAQGPPPGIGPRHPLAAVGEFPARIRQGRPHRLLIRAAVAAVLSLAVLQLIPGTAAAPADITAMITWLVLTGRRDLAPPPER